MRMIRINPLLLGCFLMAGFISCQKEIEGTLPDRVQNDSTDLARIIILDTTLPSGSDTLYIYGFQYDSQKRRTLEIFTMIDNSSSTRVEWFYRYYFLNNDTLPYRITERFAPLPDSISHYFEFTNGFINKDSIVDHSPLAMANRVFYYSAIGAGRFLQKGVDYELATGASQVVDSTIYSRSVVAGNVISGRDSTWINAFPMLFRVNSSQFSFDNKPNPHAKLALWYLGHFGTFDNQMYYTNGINNTVAASYSEIFPTSSTEVNSFSYSYHVSGYPSIMRINSTDGNKLLFVYTKL